MQNTAYKIELEVFEGPLDLLLHLIRKNEMEITDIPIVTILDQYMEYLGLMEELNIDLAGDFLLMASELAHIKSKMLLPVQEQGSEEDDEVEDPRAALIQRLLEYQRYKEVVDKIAARPMLNRDVFYRGSEISKNDEVEPDLEVDVFQLIHSFQQILKRAPKRLVHEVGTERLSVSERIYELIDLLKSKDVTAFTEIFTEDHSRDQMIVTFLALLEMTRLKLLRITQTEDRGEIYLKSLEQEMAAEEIAQQVTLQ